MPVNPEAGPSAFCSEADLRVAFKKNNLLPKQEVCIGGKANALNWQMWLRSG